MKNLIKILFTLLGIAILIFGIISEIDGIGRFAVILFGTVFSLAGALMGFTKKK